MKTKELNDWTRKEFEALSLNEWDKNIGEFDSLVILPTRHLHDSGYKCMDFVAVINDKPICRLSGRSDVIHFDGIGGFGDHWLEKYKAVPKLIPPIGWCIDCLKISRLLRIFTHGKLKAGTALSSFELYSIKEQKSCTK